MLDICAVDECSVCTVPAVSEGTEEGDGTERRRRVVGRTDSSREVGSSNDQAVLAMLEFIKLRE